VLVVKLLLISKKECLEFAIMKNVFRIIIIIIIKFSTWNTQLHLNDDDNKYSDKNNINDNYYYDIL